MANRHILHVSKLDDFILWLKQDGWLIQPCKGYYEKLRAKKGKRTLIVYFRFADILNHYTVQDKDVSIVKAYLRDRRKNNEPDDSRYGNA